MAKLMILMALCAFAVACNAYCMDGRGRVTCYGSLSLQAKQKQMTKLSLQYGNNWDIAAIVMPNLFQLSISDCLTPASFHGNSFNGKGHLESLDISCTVTGTLNLSPLVNLQTLSLQNAGLDSKTIRGGFFNGLTKLTTLSLKGNTLKDIASNTFAGLKALGILNLQSTGLQTLQPNVFAGLSQVTSITLTDNDLTELSAPMFTGLKSIENIYLRSNSIATIHPGTFDNLKTVRHVQLDNNDLRRDNQLCSIARLLQGGKVVTTSAVVHYIQTNKLDHCDAPCTSVPIDVVCPGSTGQCSGTVGQPICGKDQDECADGTHMCTANGKCINTNGGYKCKCDRLFFGETCTYWYGGQEEYHKQVDNCEHSEFFFALPDFSLRKDSVTLQQAIDKCKYFGLDLPTRQAEHCFYDSTFRRIFYKRRQKSVFFFANELEKYAVKNSYGMDFFEMINKKQAQFLCFADWKQSLTLISHRCKGKVFSVPKHSNMHPGAVAITWAHANNLCSLVKMSDFQGEDAQCLQEFVKAANQLFGLKERRVWVGDMSHHSTGNDGNYGEMVSELQSVKLLPICTSL